MQAKIVIQIVEFVPQHVRILIKRIKQFILQMCINLKIALSE